MFTVVGKWIRGPRGDLVAVAEDAKVVVVRHSAQGDDDPEVGEKIQFPLQVGATAGELLGGGLVAGRCATHRRRDIEICEPQAVVTGNGGRLGGEPGLVQDAVEEVSGGVPGKHAAGAIGAVGARGQPDEEHPGVRVSEGGHRAAPVGEVLVSAALLLGYETAMVD